MRGPTETRPGGFTLLEVMAAVLILGMLYSVLATSAIQGVRSEGESKRRLQASLIADAQLDDIETGLAEGDTPDVGDPQESEDGDFAISTQVEPFDLTPYLSDDFLKANPDVETLLAPADHPEKSLLRRITVSVRWLEAGEQFEVHRTTFAYDVQTVEAMFPESGGETAGDKSGLLNPDGTPNPSKMLNPDGTPNLDNMRKLLGIQGKGQ